MMNINWVVANTAQLDPTVNLDQFKEIGSIWGGWQSWRNCQTDNVICHSATKAQQLIENKFPTLCNFYIPNSVYTSLGRPEGVQLYEGAFVHDIDGQEEIVALHLAASRSDIVLLLGFDFTEPIKIEDRLLEHRAHHYRSLVKQVINDNIQTQWVLVDHEGDVHPELADFENLTKDTLDNVIELLRP